MQSKDEDEDEDPLDFNEDLLCDHCKSFTLHVIIAVLTCDISSISGNGGLLKIMKIVFNGRCLVTKIYLILNFDFFEM